ncbi:class I SAM-dependent methyltransferase [Natronorubrum texcoconense]|uniref:Methyltransferase domain-containing protein n=1 Tax=Natronorubrum texcoconense TaxID=1095776 RepID=A0A1G8UMJ1_9EURY|nr:class I SAM-dependent methyltransferase [Natronorubrum texcoconense]SDJ55003.1 Methyltransferase domain-containing protein [Natronorubrum texcoconense]
MDRFRNTRQPDWDWWGKLWPTPGETLRELGLESGDTVAEIGSGNGYFALPAARIVAPASVYALDIDESLLAELSHLADQQAIENVTVLTGDARELSQHLPEPADVVLIANTFHGIDEPDTFVQQAYESLRSEGRFIVINWTDRPRETTRIAGEPRGPPTELRLSPEATERTVLDAAAFALDETVELPPYHYALVFER